LKCINTNDQAQHLYLANSMPFDREAAYRFDDKLQSDRHRHFVYGLHDSIQKMMSSSLARPRGEGIPNPAPVPMADLSHQQHQEEESKDRVEDTQLLLKIKNEPEDVVILERQI
ncbi:hypothetical protein PMAYCL1PPCAC_28822, partial [Pristionchus mayeri]